MSALLVYICTKSTVDPYVAPSAADLRMLARDVSDGFLALSGGYRMVGQLAFFPLQRSVPGHLLCDGREVPKASFPELYSYLGNTEGTPVDPDNFVLPNYVGATAFEPAATSEPETVDAGTSTAPAPVDPAIPDYDWYDEVYKQWDNAGRPPNFLPPP